jgi:hypothetical protein
MKGEPMPKRKVIDNKDLLRDIKEGIPQKELLKKYGFKTPISLKMAQLKALEEEQGIIPIKGAGRTKKDKPVETKIQVNKKGTLSIPKILTELMYLKPGDTFELKSIPKINKAVTKIELIKLGSEGPADPEAK